MRTSICWLIGMFGMCSPLHAQNSPDWLGVDGFEFATPTVFRFTDLDLRDPHVFLPITIAPFPTLCVDFTDTAIPTTSISFNSLIQNSYNGDTNPADGILDASSLLWFRPLRQNGSLARVDNGAADCLAPTPSAGCVASLTASPTPYVYASASGSCLAPIAGTIGSPAYMPAISTPSAACFVTAAKTLVFDNGGTPITLTSAQIGANFIGNPATALNNGLIRGFLREVDANQVIISNPALPGGSVPLSGLLPGGQGSCSARNDKDTHLGETGWWFYFNFTASPVVYSE